jgi:hypothetical protein
MSDAVTYCSVPSGDKRGPALLRLLYYRIRECALRKGQFMGFL